MVFTIPYLTFRTYRKQEAQWFSLFHSGPSAAIGGGRPACSGCIFRSIYKCKEKINHAGATARRRVIDPVLPARGFIKIFLIFKQPAI